MEETTGPNRSTVPLEGQPRLQPTTRQRILNIIFDKAKAELEKIDMLETQGLYITANVYVTGLLEKEIEGIFNDPNISGRRDGDSLVFNSSVSNFHEEGGNEGLSGIKPEHREAGKLVIDNETELKIYTVPKEKKRDTINLINEGKLTDELDSI